MQEDSIGAIKCLGIAQDLWQKNTLQPQIAMGGVTGCCVGFLFQKVGKLAATTAGVGFLLQIASHSGYLWIDQKRAEKDVNKVKRQIKK